MSGLRLRSGNSTVTLDDDLSDFVRQALEASHGAIVQAMEDEVQAVHRGAVERAPVKSGRFRRGLRYHLEIDPSSDEIKATITSEAPYTRWIRSPVMQGYDSVWQGLVAAPMRRAGKRLVTRLGDDIAGAMKGEQDG